MSAPPLRLFLPINDRRKKVDVVAFVRSFSSRALSSNMPAARCYKARLADEVRLIISEIYAAARLLHK